MQRTVIGNLWELLTSSSHRYHGLRVVCPFQTEAFDSRESGDDNIGLVGSAGPVVSVKFKTSGTCTGKQTLCSWQAELLTHSYIVGATIGCTCRGWVCRGNTVWHMKKQQQAKKKTQQWMISCVTHSLDNALSELWVQKHCLAAQSCWHPWTCPHALWPQSCGQWSRGSFDRQPHPRGETGLSLWWCGYSHLDHHAQSVEIHMPDRQSN